MLTDRVQYPSNINKGLAMEAVNAHKTKNSGRSEVSLICKQGRRIITRSFTVVERINTAKNTRTFIVDHNQ